MPQDVGVGRAVDRLARAPGRRGAHLGGEPAGADPPVAVADGGAVAQLHRVDHAVAGEPVVAVRVRHHGRVGPVAHEQALERRGDGAVHRQRHLDGALLGHRGEVAREVRVHRAPPYGTAPRAARCRYGRLGRCPRSPPTCRFRGLVHQVTDPALLGRLDGGPPVVAYIGFDPSAPSLHVGQPPAALHAAAAPARRPPAHRPGRRGHRPDRGPGREGRRAAAARPTRSWRPTWRASGPSSSGSSTSRGPAGALLLDNADWLGPWGRSTFLRDVGKHFTVNQMMAKESVQARSTVRSRASPTPSSATCCCRPTTSSGCTRTTAARSRWAGATSGATSPSGWTWSAGWPGPRSTASPRRSSPRPTAPSSARRSAATVWLDPAMTSPYRLYQFLLQSEDAVVGHYLRYFTFLAHDEILALDAETADRPQRRAAQRALAREVCALVHGEARRRGPSGPRRRSSARRSPAWTRRPCSRWWRTRPSSAVARGAAGRRRAAPGRRPGGQRPGRLPQRGPPDGRPGGRLRQQPPGGRRGPRAGPRRPPARPLRGAAARPARLPPPAGGVSRERCGWPSPRRRSWRWRSWPSWPTAALGRRDARPSSSRAWVDAAPASARIWHAPRRRPLDVARRLAEHRGTGVVHTDCGVLEPTAAGRHTTACPRRHPDHPAPGPGLRSLAYEAANDCYAAGATEHGALAPSARQAPGAGPAAQRGSSSTGAWPASTTAVAGARGSATTTTDGARQPRHGPVPGDVDDRLRRRVLWALPTGLYVVGGRARRATATS